MTRWPPFSSLRPVVRPENLMVPSNKTLVTESRGEADAAFRAWEANGKEVQRLKAHLTLGAAAKT